jgi:hypothetical protein
VGHRGDGRQLALDGVEATFDTALRGEHLLHLCRVWSS